MDLSRTLHLRGLAFAAVLVLAACSEPPAEDAPSEPVPAEEAALPATGTISGPLTFPSDYLPDDLTVCARNVETGDQFCDADKTGATYSLAVAAGRYTVWAQTGDMPGYRATWPENRPIFRQTARDGHFGIAGLPWERLINLGGLIATVATLPAKQEY